MVAVAGAVYGYAPFFDLGNFFLSRSSQCVSSSDRAYVFIQLQRGFRLWTSGVFDEVAAKERFDDENWGEEATKHATALTSTISERPEKWSKIIAAAKDACKKVAYSSISHDAQASSALPEIMALSDPETDEEMTADVDGQVAVGITEAEDVAEGDQERDEQERPESVAGSGGEEVDVQASDDEEVAVEESGDEEMAVEEEGSVRYDYGIADDEGERSGADASDAKGTPAPDDIAMTEDGSELGEENDVDIPAIDDEMVV